jgi:hypothetical protein
MSEPGLPGAASTSTGRGRIFISYRREDSAYPAGWLYDRLCAHLGSENVFKDVDSIEPGDDFVRVLEEAVVVRDTARPHRRP